MFWKMDKGRKQHKLTNAEIVGLRRYLDEHGHAAACECIGIVRTTAYRAMAHDSVSRGTLTQIRVTLARAEQQGRTP